MQSKKSFWLIGPLIAVVSLASTACRDARDTAGRPGMESGDGAAGSTAATKEGTGDPHVGSGHGKVGTDAPPGALPEKGSK